MKSLLRIAIFCCCLVNILQAQDLHFSQFHAAPLQVNPSLTGIFNGDMRFMGNFRSQWVAVPVPYMTFSAAYDQKILKVGKSGGNALSGGMYLSYDQTGDSELSLLQIGTSIAYAQQINKNNFLSIGIMLGVGQRRFRTDNLTFDEQYIDGTFIPNTPISENFNNTSFGFVDVSMGLTYLVKFTDRLKFSVGSSVWHLNQPKYSFLNTDNSRLSRKYGVHLDATIPISPRMDLLPSAIFFMQDGYLERMVGAYWKYYLDDRKGMEKALLIGTWYRINDAAIGAVAIDYGFWRVGLSYDVNTSSFAVATRGRGGFELSGQYIISKVKPLEKKKICPIF